ncbi:MAG: peptidase M50 [Puniceicoccaceae bacterium 5H]|nr:MAG: peptidase M50 [Puniceicoccaceae bacterium 5H]
MRDRSWSIPLFKILGVRLDLHLTFLLLLVYAGWMGATHPARPIDVPPQMNALWWILLVMGVFACVVMHEFGHILAARRYGVATRRILLLPIGGVAEMDQLPRQPGREFIVTAAGPAVNFAIALLVYLLLQAMGAWPGLNGLERAFVPFDGIGFLLFMLIYNLTMGIFNLVPVYPMDGGRILRSLLATRLDYLTATRWSVWVAKPLALAAALFAILNGSWQPAILFGFIYLAGDLEYQAIRRDELMRGVSMGEVSAHRWRAVPAEITLGEALTLMRREQVPEIVVQLHPLPAVLVEEEVRELAEEHPWEATLGSLPLPRSRIADATAPLGIYLPKLEPKVGRILIYHQGQLVAVFRQETMQEVLAWRTWEKKLARNRPQSNMGGAAQRRRTPPPLPHGFSRGTTSGPGHVAE